MKSLSIFGLFLAVSIFSLAAHTVVIPDENISIDVPDGWRQLDTPPGMLLSAAGGPYILQVVKSPNPRNVDLNSAVIDNIKNGISSRVESRGGTVTFGDEGPLTMGGAPAYVIRSEEETNSHTIGLSLYVVDANKSVYAIYLVTTGSLPDTTLQGIADSFRFISPPTLPESTFERRAFKLGIAFGVLLVVAAAGLGVWYFVRRR